MQPEEEYGKPQPPQTVVNTTNTRIQQVNIQYVCEHAQTQLKSQQLSPQVNAQLFNTSKRNLRQNLSNLLKINFNNSSNQSLIQQQFYSTKTKNFANNQ